MLKIKCTIIIAIIFSSIALPQNKLFIPRNVEKAFKQNTRSYDGKPGVNYWQNSASYKIKADVNPFSKWLTGTSIIIYKNNSPDTLKSLVVRLYQNINKPGIAKDFSMRTEKNDGVVLSKLVVNKNEYNFNERKQVEINGTNMIVKLISPIQPKSEVQLEINWSFELPAGPSIRFGAYDSTSYFIAYWYPQIAVYDDIDGWDTNEYLGTTEFYNDFSDFDIEITLPKNFFLWSTGTLQNSELLFSEKILNKYNQSFYSDEIIHVIEKDDLGKRTLLKNNSEKNTWKVKAEHVPDFAFGFSDHYLWDASSLLVDSVSGRRVQINAVYKEQSSDFFSVCDASKKVVDHFSNIFPGVDYPYPQITVFNGAGGMEFPMIVNNGSESSFERAASLAAHEIAHTYFPFYMGINERKYAWMDEGYAVIFTNDFQENVLTDYSERSGNVKSYERFAGTESELPLVTPSTQMRWTTYRIAAYNKPSVAYHILRKLLGDEIYQKSLKEFITRWNGKHPVPHDYFHTFENVTGEDLSWFWKPWFFDHGYPDLTITEYKMAGNELFVKVKKSGSYPVPVLLTCYNTIGEKYTHREEAIVWKNGNNEYEIRTMISGYPAKIEIGDENIPDVNRSDNFLDLNKKQ